MTLNLRLEQCGGVRYRAAISTDVLKVLGVRNMRSAHSVSRGNVQSALPMRIMIHLGVLRSVGFCNGALFTHCDVCKRSVSSYFPSFCPFFLFVLSSFASFFLVSVVCPF